MGILLGRGFHKQIQDEHPYLAAILYSNTGAIWMDLDMFGSIPTSCFELCGQQLIYSDFGVRPMI